jgi:predicted metal-dependent hydrolase
MPDISTHHYDDGTHRFDYTLILKPRMRHRYIRIRDGRVIVTASRRTPQHTIEAFVEAKADWIVHHLNATQKSRPMDLASPDAYLYWRGEHCSVRVEHSKTARLTIEDGTACFALTHPPDHVTLVTLFQAHCKQNAPRTLLPRIKHWGAIMELQPTRIGFRRARTRWGSCSSRNSLSFNTWMMILPDPLIDYIIVHELAHIRHKNHGHAFWDLVAHHLPDWQHRRKALRAYEPFLF